MRNIYRDSFARQTTVRENVYLVSGTCDWCGNVKTTPKGRKYLYRYGSDSDGGRLSMDRHLFCSKGCHDIYHG